MALCILACLVGHARALTPDSPAVKEAVRKAIAFLESDAAKDQRLGARALIGLALLKNGAEKDHAKVQEAAATIQRTLGPLRPEALNLDLYSSGLSIIFLVTLDPSKYRPEIECLLNYMKLKQKPHGGWGYDKKETGDTSMTQYAVLSAWEATQEGFAVPPEQIEAVATWLLKTQDPSGGFGYQGHVSSSFTLVAQKDIKQSMTAAGAGSLLICADLLKLIERARPGDPDVPAALREVRPKDDGPNAGAGAEAKTKLSPKLFKEAQSRAARWLRSHTDIEPKGWTHYYLYALERYASFRELADGKAEREPRWYSDGAKFLVRTQNPDGSWQSKSGTTADTAFATLFLLRSTKKSIEKARGLSGGTMIVGRGMPAQTERIELRDGRLLPRLPRNSAVQIGPELDKGDPAALLQALEDLAALKPDERTKVVASRTARLQQLARHADADVRFGAIRALGAVRNFDNAPALIAALGDTDARVALEAREALVRLSRRAIPPAAETRDPAAQRRAEVAAWKSWYRALQPESEWDD